MATRRLLAELAVPFERRSGSTVTIESIGGVDAARRVRAGEPIDLIVLAANVMQQLEDEGRLVPGSRRDIASSGIAIAIRTGTPHPAIATEADVKQAVLEGGTVCYSSGPSGNHLKALFERWGIAGAIAGRTLEAKPGIPVGELVANGDADLGFQQLSELLDVPGIEIVGPMPPEIQTMTSFTAGIGSMAPNAEGARAFIAYLVSPETLAVKQRLGMEAGS